jgi:protein TonB
MRVVSPAVSVTAHVAIGVLVLVGTTKRARSTPAPSPEIHYVVTSAPRSNSARAEGQGVPLTVPSPLDGGTIPVASPVINGVVPIEERFPTSIPTGPGVSGSENAWTGAIGEAGPEVLSGPLPMYPELLRQAGMHGRVVLEAVIDTSGHVLPASIVVIRSTHPGFVPAARQALLATLFRPAMVGGRAVSMRVQIPYDFAIRSGSSF